ncbi:hypothetical protein WA158_001993 [Blastocystis sp. Blastoise]
METKKLSKKAKVAKTIGSNWDAMKSLITGKKTVKRSASDKSGNTKKVKKDENPALIGKAIIEPDPNGHPGETPVIALDCEMVGTGSDDYSALARVSIVNYDGYVLLDTFVKPPEKVTDYRTRYSGVRESDLENAPPFKEVQKQIGKIIKGKVVVGHAIENDFQAMLLDHPFKFIRDTSHYRRFLRKIAGRRGRPQALRKLVEKEFGLKIQEGEHSSVIDARATLALYKKYRNEWEMYIHSRKQYEKEERARRAREEVNDKEEDKEEEDDDEDNENKEEKEDEGEEKEDKEEEKKDEE